MGQGLLDLQKLHSKDLTGPHQTVLVTVWEITGEGERSEVERTTWLRSIPSAKESRLTCEFQMGLGSMAIRATNRQTPNPLQQPWCAVGRGARGPQ